MKKIIYITVIVSIVLSCVVMPTFASESKVFPTLMYDTTFALDYMQTTVCDDWLTMAQLASTDTIVLITSLSNVPASLQVWGDYNGTETILSSTTMSSYGDTINLSRYNNGIYRYVLVDQYDQPQKFLYTMIEGEDDYMASFSDYYKSLIQYLLESYESGAIIEKPVLDPIACLSCYKLTLNAGDKCVITFNETLASPKFKITKDGAWVDGLTYPPDMLSGYSYTLVAETAGDYYFDFYDTVTGDAGRFTIYRVLANGSPDYMQGFIDGMQQDGSYSEGYNAGNSDGYTEGYNQALKDNPDDGSYANGVVAGEANIFSQMREYMIAQGVDPASVPNSVEGLLEYYAASKNANGGSNNNGDQGSSDSGELTYEEGYQNGWNAGYEYAGSYYIPELDQKYNEGREYTMDLILGYLDRKKIDIPPETPHAVSMYLDLVYNAKDGAFACDSDHDAIYNAGKEAGIVLGRAEGFDSSVITEGVDSIVEGSSRTFLQVLNVEVLGYTLGSVVIGFIMVVFVFFAVKFIGSIL